MSVLISVLVPTYRRPDLVVQAVQSAQLQTYQNLEILVGEDAAGSGESGIGEAIRRLGAVDRRVRYIPIQEHVFQSGALSRLFAESEGEYVQLLDDDDLLHPQKLARELDLIQKMPEVGIVGGYIQMFRHQPGDSDALWNRMDGQDHLLRYLRRNQTWVTVGMLFRRSALQPFFPLVLEDQPALDFVLALQVLASGWQGFAHAHIASYYRVTTQNKVSNLTEAARPAVHFRLFLWASETLQKRGLFERYREEVSLTLRYIAFRALLFEDRETAARALLASAETTADPAIRKATSALVEPAAHQDPAQVQAEIAAIQPLTLREGWWGAHRIADEPIEPMPKARRYGRS